MTAVCHRHRPDLYDPDGYVGGPPHEVLAELRRTQPVYFQEMPDEPGYWAVLKHADVVHVAREPQLFSASEGGVVLENLEPETARDDAQHAAGDGPAAPRRLPAADRAALQGPGDRGLEDQIRAICREIMADAAAAGRRRVRARRHLARCRRRSSVSSWACPPRTWPRSTGWRR